MKKTFAFAAAAIALLALSCQTKEENATTNEPIVITAMVDPVSRVAYEETGDHKLAQAWEVDDVLVGKDDSDNDITMRVASVDGSGVATLEITDGDLPATGSIHMMYFPRSVGNTDWPHNLNLSGQTVAVGTTVPAILTADAAVSGTSVNLNFVNRTAVLGIKGFHGLPAGAEVSRFIVSGVTAMASVSVSAGTIAISPMAMISTVILTKSSTWTANASGEVEDVFYVAAFPNDTPSVIRIQAELADGTYYCNELGSKTVSAAKYYYMNDKELQKVVAYVDNVPCVSIEDALVAANALGGYCAIRLVSDCAASQELYLTANEGPVSLELNGHTLNLNGFSLNVHTAGTILNISDMIGGGGMLQTGNSSLLYVKEGTVNIGNAVFDCSGSGRILRMQGGTVNVHEGTSFIQRPASTYMMLVRDGSLNIDGGEFEHASATGYPVIYTETGTPSINISGGVFKCKHTSYNPFIFNTASVVNIGGDATFINTGSKTTFSFALPANSNNVHITGGYFYPSNVFASSNSNVVTISGGYYSASSITYTRCSYKASHSLKKITPSVSREGKTFTYKVLHTNLQGWSFSIADGVTAYPAQRNSKYVPSTSSWGFQSSDENYTSGYKADEVNLFTWGLPSEYTNPASASGRVGLVGGQNLEKADDWGSFMPSEGLLTLTRDQWDYLLNTRNASTVNGIPNARYMKCTFQDSKGLLIFPDSFTWPANAGAESTATAINDPSADFSVTYYRSQAGYLTASGCIFLRADGYRDGTDDYDGNSKGYYWTSTTAGSNEPWYLYFDSSDLSLKHDSGTTVGKGAAVRVFSK